jgi:acetolactate decarboxylase
MGGLNSIGWHFHFITEDLKQGGHVLQVSVDEAVAELDATSGFELILPEDDAEFQTMDLSRNMDEAIHRAETATSEDAAAATSEDTP